MGPPKEVSPRRKKAMKTWDQVPRCIVGATGLSGSGLSMAH
jgi:hypothetical protein